MLGTLKFRYYLEKNKNSLERIKPENIMVEISYGYSIVNKNGRKRNLPCRIALKAKILPSNFGVKEENYKFNDSVFSKFSKKNRAIKNLMFKLENHAISYEAEFRLEGFTPSPKEFQEELKLRLGRTQVFESAPLTLIDYLESNINSYKEGEIKYGKNKLSKNTLKTYESLKILIDEYEIGTNKKVFIKDFDIDEYFKFWNFSDNNLKGITNYKSELRQSKQKKNKYGYTSNSIKKYQDALVKTLRNASHDGIDLKFDFGYPNLKASTNEKGKEFYVTTDDLQKIIKTDFSFDAKLVEAKNYLIIGCLTGMRYQSMILACDERINEFEVDGEIYQYIKSYQPKSNSYTAIPLMKPVIQIINDNKQSFPKWSSNAVLNKSLKKLFKIINSDTEGYEIKYYYKEGRVKTKKQICDLITAHDTRKSFITNLSILGVRQEDIDNITHPRKKRDNEMLTTYLKSTMVDKARQFVREINKVDSELYYF